MKDALNEDNALIEAGPDAPEQAKCPACEGVVVLRSRRVGRDPADKTWFYRHRRGEGPRCSRRFGLGVDNVRNLVNDCKILKVNIEIFERAIF